MSNLGYENAVGVHVVKNAEAVLSEGVHRRYSRSQVYSVEVTTFNVVKSIIPSGLEMG